MTPHMNAKQGQIANIVLMPGDPLRAKLIAEKYLEKAELVNDIRGIYAYTGYYKGKRISVMASGMGMPSMGIYCYELYQFYGVDTIIRIGSAGGYTKDLKLFDLIIVDRTYTESNYALTLNNDDCHTINASEEINSIIEKTAQEQTISYIKCNTLCSDCFDAYMTDKNKLLERLPKEFEVQGAEMEAFALFYIAKLLNKKAGCILTVVDSHFYHEEATAEQRENSLHNMIQLGLETTLKIK